MKIMIASTLYHPIMLGGAEKIAQIVAESLQVSGHDVVVVTTSPKSGVDCTFVNGVKVYTVGLKNIYWQYGASQPGWKKAIWHGIDRYNPWMGARFAAILAQERPDVLNTHSLTGLSCAIWPAAKRQRIPIHHTLHDYSLMCPKATMYQDGQNCARQCGTCRLYTRRSRQYSQLVDGVIGVSHFTLDKHLQAGYFAAAAVQQTIYNGLPDRHEPQRQLGSGPAPLCIGFVGRLVPQKGIEMLLDAAVALRATGCTVLVAGKGDPEYERELQRRYACPSVRFLGFVDPDVVYRQIDVLAVPSLWEEPLGMIVLESYTHGIPVIVADSGGMPELVEHGATGLIFNKAIPGALQSALRAFIDDRHLAPSMQARVREKSTHFRLDAMKAAYLSVLQAAQEKK